MLGRATDSVPVPGTRVVIHRVGRAAEGPVDSTVTDRAGRFRFRFNADTGWIYLVSAAHGGLEYFATPVHLDPERPDTALRIVVFDTSATQPIGLAARHLVVAAPKPDGTRSMLDVIVLSNPGARTRVAVDSLHPSWAGPLPPGSLGLAVGQGDYSPEAVERMGDRLVFLGPVAPGEKRVLVEYVVPAGLRDLRLPVEQPIPLLNLLVEEPDARVLTPGLRAAGTEVIRNLTYQRWSGALGSGDTLRARLSGAGPLRRWLLPALVSLVAAALGLAAYRLLPPRPARPPPPVLVRPAEADRLFEALAELDARYADREHETAPTEWEHYRSERARLKAELEAALASEARAP